MKIKSHGVLKIDCEFAAHREFLTLEYECRGDGWYWGKLTATQCGGSFTVPFVFTQAGIEDFIQELKRIEEKLELPMTPAMLYNFDTSNLIVIGPLIAHRGIMFADVILSLPDKPDDHHLGTGIADMDGPRYYQATKNSHETPEGFAEPWRGIGT